MTIASIIPGIVIFAIRILSISIVAFAVVIALKTAFRIVGLCRVTLADGAVSRGPVILHGIASVTSLFVLSAIGFVLMGAIAVGIL